MNHTIKRPGRASTTAKITRRALTLIGVALLYGEGVIVRFRGREYGVIGITPGRQFRVFGSDELIPIAACTIRKGTTEAIDQENNGVSWYSSDPFAPVAIASLESVAHMWRSVQRMIQDRNSRRVSA
jgi:hypothetical protein